MDEVPKSIGKGILPEILDDLFDELDGIHNETVSTMELDALLLEVTDYTSDSIDTYLDAEVIRRRRNNDLQRIDSVAKAAFECYIFTCDACPQELYKLVSHLRAGDRKKLSFNWQCHCVQFKLPLAQNNFRNSGQPATECQCFQIGSGQCWHLVYIYFFLSSFYLVSMLWFC